MREEDSPSAPEGPRKGDTLLGRPRAHASTGEPGQTTLSALQEEERRQAREAAEQLITDPPIRYSLRWLKGLFLLLPLAVGLIGWFLLSQFVWLSQALAQAPIPVQVVGWMLVVLLTTLVAWPLWRLLCRYRRLSRVHQIDLLSVHPSGSEVQYAKARELLSDYLTRYPLESVEQGAWELDVEKLDAQRHWLLEETTGLDSHQWCREFEARFLNPIDKAAEGCIQQHARNLALRSAISPNALLDAAVGLYTGFCLLDDLSRLYGLRLEKSDLAYLLALVIFMAYFEGQVEEQLDDYLSDNLEPLLGTLTGSLVSKAGSAATGAAAGFLFIRRIGRTMKQRVRPLK